jgi:hypothetical protein
VSDPLQVEACQYIAQLWHREGLGLVLLSHDCLRHAPDTTASRQVLDQSLRRALSNKDLFQLDGPALGLFDFFGRETALQTLIQACQAGQAIGLGGMVKVGKTSLAQRVMDHLSGALVAWMDLDGPPTARLYADVRQAWPSSTG